MVSKHHTALVILLVVTTGCIGNSGLESSWNGVVVENPPDSLTEDLPREGVRVQAEDDDLLIAYSIGDRDIVGNTEAAVEVAAANDSSRHYCPGDSSGVLRVPFSPHEAGYSVALSEDDRLLPTSPCRATDKAFGTRGSIATARWEPEETNRSD